MVYNFNFITSNDLSVTYEARITDYANNSILNLSIPIISQLNDTTKLYIDSQITLQGTGQIYNLNVIINSVFAQSSIPAITNDNICTKFGLNFICLECPTGYTLTNSICEIDVIVVPTESYSLFNLLEVYNNGEQTYNIPNDYFSVDHTIYLNIRKLVHSIIQDSNNTHNLVRYGGITLLSEEILADYISTITLGSITFDKNFSCEIYDFIQVLISINKNDNIATIIIRNLDTTDLISTIDITGASATLTLGDSNGIEIQFEFKAGIVYGGASATEIEQNTIFSNTLVDLDPTCLVGDYFTGICSQCFGSATTGLLCNNSIIGFSYNYVFGYTSFDDFTEENYSYEIINALQSDVNSLQYGVFGRVKLLTIDLTTNAYYKLLELRNDPHINYEIPDPSRPLIAFIVRIQNGAASYYWQIVTASAGVIEIPVSSNVIANEWVLIGASINVTTGVFTYNVIPNSSIVTLGEAGSFTLSGCNFEKLQSVGQLISFGAESDASEGVSVPNAASSHIYLVPNLRNYNTILLYFISNLAPIATTDLPNCEVELYNPDTSSPICVVCEDTYILVSGSCVPA